MRQAGDHRRGEKRGSRPRVYPGVFTEYLEVDRATSPNLARIRDPHITHTGA